MCSKYRNVLCRSAIIATLLSCMFAAMLCHAQTLSQVAISGATNPIVIDGYINETAWSKAARVSNFDRCDASKLIAEPDEQTFVYLTYDSINLYIAVRCFQNTEKIIAMMTQRDGRLYKDDSFEFYIRPNPSIPNEYFIFGTNSNGVKYDADAWDSEVHPEWNPNWSVATQVYSTCWDAEIALPWYAVGVDAPISGATSIPANFIRYLQTDGEKLSYGPSNYGWGYTSSWSLGANPTSLHDMSNWGTINFYDYTPVVRLNQYADTASGSLGYTGEVVNNTGATLDIAGQLVVTDPYNVQHTLNTGYIPLGPGGSSAIEQMYGCTNYQFKSDSTITMWYQGWSRTLLKQGNTRYNNSCLKLKKYFFEGNIEPSISIEGLRVLNPTYVRFNLWSGSTMINYTILPVSVSDPNNLYSTIFFVGTLPAGPYSVSVDVRDVNNTLLYSEGIAFDKPADPPWLNITLGTEDIVLAPWTPISWNGGTSTFSCWGRTYQFNTNALPVPSSMVTQSQELLAGPMVVNAVINGSPVTWTPTQSINATATATKATLATGHTGSGATLSGNTQIEYDGMAKVNLNLTGNAGLTLNSLTLDIPIRKDVATLLLADPTDAIYSGTFPYWRGAKNGLIPATTVSGPFTPYMWLGNDRLGLIWFCESQENWSNVSWNNAIEIVPQVDRVVLRVKFVDSPISLATPLGLVFGLQATPVKPAAPQKKWSMYLGYGSENPNMAADNSGNGSITYPAAGNINLPAGTVHLWTTVNFDCNTPVPGLAGGFPRYDDPWYPLFSLESPTSCNMFGFYWNAVDATYRFIVRRGDVVLADYPVNLPATINPAWLNGQSRLVTISWSVDRVQVLLDGTEVLYGTFVNPFASSSELDLALLRFGGPYTLDAVKIKNTTFTGGTPTPTIDAETLLLDDYSQVAGGLTLPQMSYNSANGTLNGTWAVIGNTIKLTASKDVVSWVEMWARRGKEISHIHENWTETQGYPKTNLHQTEFTSLRNAVDASGMKFLPYLGFQIGDNSTEYQNYKDEIVVEPWVYGHGYYRSDTNPHHFAYDCNYSGQWQNFMVYNIEKLIREQGVTGFFFDGTSIPLPNKNLHDGTGYYDRNGTLRPGYPIFEYRDYFKRIRTIAQQYDPTFWMDIHTTVGIWTPIASFADSYWCGEQFEMMMVDTGKSLRELVGNDLPLDACRAWYGSQFGLDGYFLNYNSWRDAQALALIHDTPVRLNEADPCPEAAKAKFGVSNATWYGYYENSAYVNSSDPNVKASFYKRAIGDILFVMSNLGTTTVTPTITLLAPLGTLQGTEVRDAITGQTIAHTDTTMSVTLDPWRARLIAVNRDRTGDIAYWKFDSSGALVNDSSPNGYNLTNNGVTWSSDKAASAPGAGSAYFDGNQTVFSTISNVTLSSSKMEVPWWAKFSMPGTGVTYLFEDSDDWSTHAGAISCDWESPGRLNFNVCKGPGLSWWTSSINGGNDGQWHFYKAVVDRTAATANDFIKLYRDGQLLGQLIQNPGTGWDQPFYDAGRMYVGSHADLNQKYVGYLDELRITAVDPN